MELSISSLASALSQGSGLHGLLGQRVLLRPQSDATLTAAERLIEVGVSATGAASKVPGTAFGPQGEGAIEGVVGDYITAGLHAHGGFRFSRWQGCPMDKASQAT